MQNKPGIDDGNRLAILENNTAIVLLETEPVEIIIDGVKEKWVKARRGDLEGWVSGAYLVPEQKEDKLLTDKLVGLWIITERDGRKFSEYAENDLWYFCFYDDGTYCFNDREYAYQHITGFYRFNNNTNNLHFWGVRKMMGNQVPWDYHDNLKFTDNNHLVLTSIKDGSITRASRSRQKVYNYRYDHRY